MSRERLRGAGSAWARTLALCAAVVLVDQATKEIVRDSLAEHHSEALVLGFKLTNVTNTGLAFGIGDGEAFVLVVTLAALAAVIVWFAMDPLRPGLWLAAGLLVGGALGNLVDRIRADAVTDFIDAPLWPAFNVADIAITLGALCLVLASLAPAPGDEPGRP